MNLFYDFLIFYGVSFLSFFFSARFVDLCQIQDEKKSITANALSRNTCKVNESENIYCRLRVIDEAGTVQMTFYVVKFY